MTPFAASLEKPSMTRTATAPLEGLRERRVVELRARAPSRQARAASTSTEPRRTAVESSAPCLQVAPIDRRLGARDDGERVEVPALRSL